jgi:hypothetical protein
MLLTDSDEWDALNICAPTTCLMKSVFVATMK